MKSNQITELVHTIRAELNLTRGVSPRIENVFQHEDESLHLIASDRAEKSLLLGPGGRVAAELAKRTSKKVTIYGADEILLRKHRLQLTKSRIKEIIPFATSSQSRMLNYLQFMIEQELTYPTKPIQYDLTASHNLKVALAFSGGIDSTSATMILKESGIVPDAVMVNLGHEFQNPKDIKQAEDWCNQQNIRLVKLELAGENCDLINRVDAGRVHPCGECHNHIMDRVREYSVESKHEIIVTGELLPSGRQAILVQEGLLIVHLPAALSLSKYRTESIAEKSGKKLFRRKFGCNLVAKSHSHGWKNIGPSIFRVVRELEAGVLTTGQGLEYIKDIIRHSPTDAGEQIE
ncbi:hypothetical protein E4H12_11790 [Candidatus Thorarchaeota archaeon]|nr:MAG: hypothetical protein E4H12_11790 [Candidatus Thorarchaeota archaeon]